MIVKVHLSYFDLCDLAEYFDFFFPNSFANNLDLCGPVTGRPCPGSPPFSPPPPFVPPPPISSPGEILGF